VSVRQLENSEFSGSAGSIYRFEYGLMNYRAYLPEHRKKIRTKNLLEWVHKEINCRTKNLGAFTNDTSRLGLAVFILIDMNEE
jgi:transposase-like protein